VSERFGDTTTCKQDGLAEDNDSIYLTGMELDNSSFRETIVAAIAKAKAEVTRMVLIIDEMEKLIGIDGIPAAKTTTIKGKPGSKPAKVEKGKRTPEQVNQQAKEMLAFIKKAGDGGVSGRDINAKFGKVIPTVKIFIEERTGEKLKTKGERSAMRYFAA
jgi:hypothetical protein